MEKLELRHLAGYLPYGLKVKYFDAERCEEKICTIELVHVPDELTIIDSHHQYEVLLEEIKPLVIPLSQLTKDDWQSVFEAGLGALVNVSFEITRYSGQTRLRFLSSSIEVCYEFHRQQFCTGILDFNQLLAFEKLYSLHADLHGLIEKGLALNKLEVI